MCCLRETSALRIFRLFSIPSIFRWHLPPNQRSRVWSRGPDSTRPELTRHCRADSATNYLRVGLFWSDCVDLYSTMAYLLWNGLARARELGSPWLSLSLFGLYGVISAFFFSLPHTSPPCPLALIFPRPCSGIALPFGSYPVERIHIHRNSSEARLWWPHRRFRLWGNKFWSRVGVLRIQIPLAKDLGKT